MRVETRGRKIQGDHKITQIESKRRFDDKACSIDNQMEEAYARIDWERRTRAESSLVEFVKTYMIGLTLEEPPPPLGEVVLQQMETAITAHRNYACALHRGAGKTAYVISTAVYALVRGLQRFVVIISANARASNGILGDLWRVFQIPDSDFANDYPEVVLPFTLANGSFRRRQLFQGVPTNISKTANQLIFPTYDDPRFAHISESTVVTRSITGALRGLRRGIMRPQFCLIDDIQTLESANNLEQVQKLCDILNKDVLPMSGKQRMSCLQTFTPICDGDLVSKIKNDKSWTVTQYPAIIHYPEKMDLWHEYFRLFSDECVHQTGHAESLNFYKEHFDEMNKGAEVFNPNRFSPSDGHLTAIQKLLETKFEIGDNAFLSEYQMEPVQVRYALPINPSLVASRLSPLHELEVPAENVQFVCASSDLNLSKYITTTIVVYLRDQTAVCIYRAFRKCNVPVNIPEQDYYQRVYNLLAEHGKELKALGIPNLHWVIDSNGVPFNACCDFARNSRQACGLQAAAFIGKASTQFRSFLKSRLKEECNRTLLCGNEDEHRLAGSGRKYTFWDSDLYREKVQKAFLQEVGNIGSLAWYTGGDHAKYAVQVCGEKLVYKKDLPNGTTEYRWKSNGPDHDVLDSLAQSMACYASMGFSTGFSGRNASAPHRKFAVRSRPRVRII